MVSLPGFKRPPSYAKASAGRRFKRGGDNSNFTLSLYLRKREEDSLRPLRISPIRFIPFAVAMFALLTAEFAAAMGNTVDGPLVSVKLAEEAADEPITGRLFLLITDRTDVEPLKINTSAFPYFFNVPAAEAGPLGSALDYAPLFGKDVEEFKPGSTVVVGNEAIGFPFTALSDIPAGDYTVQALFVVYTQVTRSDGHTIQVPLEDGDGQQLFVAPGNLYSNSKKIEVSPGKPIVLELELNQKISPIEPEGESDWIKRLRLKSELVSRFWGRDMYMGAQVLLPKGYDEHPDTYYPVVYFRGHFQERRPFGFPDNEPEPPGVDASGAEQALYESQKQLYDYWNSDDAPRMIVVTLQHPTPYYDSSYGVNSPNTGPWEDAIMTELIPFIEDRFRIIRKPYGRVMTGGSTGGWVSLYAQIQYPEFFGGTWSYCPDFVSFKKFSTINIYEDDNAFVPPGYKWLAPERIHTRSVEGQPRLTMRQASQMSRAFGSKTRSTEFLDNWSVVFGPVGKDGYPQPLWDHGTGKIDHDVAAYWRDNGFDLVHFLKTNWPEIGNSLVGKLHFICGDMDNFYINLSMYEMEEFLESTTDPYYDGSFRFVRPLSGHSWAGLDPHPIKLLEEMAAHISRNAPRGEDPSAWQY